MDDVERRKPRVERTGFNMGGVLSSAFAVWIRNLPTVVAITVVCQLPSFALLLTSPDFLAPTAFGEPGEHLDGPGGYLWFGASILIGLFSASITTAAVIHAVFEGLRGERVSALSSLRTGFSMLLPIVLANLLTSLICMLPLVPGFILASLDFFRLGVIAMLLAVPFMLMLGMSYFVVSAVIVSERAPPSRALDRSSELTKGSRLRILLGIIVVGVLFGVAGIVLNLAISDRTLKTVFTVVSQIVSGSFMAVLAAVVYHELRLKVDGVDRDSLASIFA